MTQTTTTTDDSVNSSTTMEEGNGNSSFASASTIIMDQDRDHCVEKEEKGTGELSSSAEAEEKIATKEAAYVDADENKCVEESTREKILPARTSASTSPKLEVEGCSAKEMDGNSEENGNSSTKVPTCAVCGEPCICYCKSCKKVCYCSKEHQKRHWKQHRSECYPVIVQVNSVFGSHLVVTRDIKRGEVILREKPLVSCPFLSNGNNGKSLPNSSESACLTCHKKIFRDQDHHHHVCSKCGWPICSEDCEKNPTHADQECEIFAECHVEPSALCDEDTQTQYLCVALIRILLQKDFSTSTTTTNGNDGYNHKANISSKWTKFMEVVNRQMSMKDGLSFAEQATSLSRFSDPITKSLGPIIRQKFSLSDAQIDQMLRTLRTCSFITDTNGNYINGFAHPLPQLPMNNNGELGHHYCSAVYSGQETQMGTDAEIDQKAGNRCFEDKAKLLSLYHLGSMLTSNCIPNASWLVMEETLEFYLRASIPIKTGERITISFVEPLLGTWERRERLWQEKYLSCSCSRCSDPSESCTFFSAIKCPGSVKECEGYILPTDPLAVTYTSWDSCKTSTSTSCFPPEGGNDSSSIIPPPPEWKCNVCLERQPWAFVQRKLRERVVPCFTTMENLEARVDEIDNFVRNVAHANHYEVLKMENELLTEISRLLEKGKLAFDQMEKWAGKMMELCKKDLKVVNVLCPGLSRERGYLLYFLQQSLVISLLFRTSRAMRIIQTSKEENESSSSSKEVVLHEELMKKFQEILLARKEVLEIFAISKENSEEARMLKAVQQDSVEVRVLKNYFKYHQNISH